MPDRTIPSGYRSVGRKSTRNLLGLMSIGDTHARVLRTSIGSLLHSVTITRGEERIVRKAVKKGSLFHDLVD